MIVALTFEKFPRLEVQARIRRAKWMWTWHIWCTTPRSVRRRGWMARSIAVCCIVSQYVTVCCCVLHCVALCCSVLKCAAVNVELSHLLYNAAQLQKAKVDVNADGCVLQCVEVCCRVLPCVTVCCSVMQCDAVCCSVLQRAAVCCHVLQGLWIWSTWRTTQSQAKGGWHGLPWQHTATHCKTLQHTASHSEMSTWYSFSF